MSLLVSIPVAVQKQCVFKKRGLVEGGGGRNWKLEIELVLIGVCAKPARIRICQINNSAVSSVPMVRTPSTVGAQSEQ